MIIDEILQTVSEETGVSKADIISKSKREEIMIARKVFVMLCKKIGIPTSAIAECLGVSYQSVSYLNKQDNRKIIAITGQNISKKMPKDK